VTGSLSKEEGSAGVRVSGTAGLGSPCCHLRCLLRFWGRLLSLGGARRRRDGARQRCGGLRRNSHFRGAAGHGLRSISQPRSPLGAIIDPPNLRVGVEDTRQFWVVPAKSTKLFGQVLHSASSFPQEQYIPKDSRADESSMNCSSISNASRAPVGVNRGVKTTPDPRKLFIYKTF